MWSGPRNLSTAMMYSFAARGDFAVWDEPFYAPYLSQTGLDHPMAGEILAHHEGDAKKVGAACVGPIPDGATHFYMKHMPHHMMPDFPMDWAKACVNVHLIRHPARVIASYGSKRADPTLDDIGFAAQLRVFEKLGGVVIDSSEIRKNPQKMLARLCAEIDLGFTSDMLKWPAGGLAQDGVWARHWYESVHKSMGFAGPEGPLPELTGTQQSLCDQVLPVYLHLKDCALR
ncbi:MAG: HAD family hydrolase [Sedimentitalea sp.]